MLYNEKLLETCDKLARRCREFGGRFRPSSAWLYDQLMRQFEHPALVSITVPVRIWEAQDINVEAEIGRDGSLVMRVVH